MKKEHLLSVLHEEIRRVPFDLKAESILTLALEKGMSQDDFVIASRSVANRPFSKDVLSLLLEEDSNRNPFLQLNLSRNGWYDQLPEGLFHQPVKSGVPILSAGKMAAEYVKNKQIELESRQFFKPFEQAFYDLRLELESEEFTLLKGLKTGKLNEFFIEFWGIKSVFPSKFITPFVEILPKIHKINGNPEQIATCLQNIIQETVEVNVETAFHEERGGDEYVKLGSCQLGLDTIIGNQFLEESVRYCFQIGPLRHSLVDDYLEGGCHQALLTVFYEYFLPVEADGIAHIKLAEAGMTNSLNQQDPPILGYSFRLAA